MLPAEVTAELAQLLQALQSSDNSIRSQAEEHLQNNWFNPRPEVLLMGLVEQISGSSDAAVSFLDTPAPSHRVAVRRAHWLTSARTYRSVPLPLSSSVG